jgi:hypothetical protein
LNINFLYVISLSPRTRRIKRGARRLDAGTRD